MAHFTLLRRLLGGVFDEIPAVLDVNSQRWYPRRALDETFDADHEPTAAVAGVARDLRPEGDPQDEPMGPHGMPVMVNAPAAFRFTASACPKRHLDAAGWLGAETRGAGEEDAAEVLSERLIALSDSHNVPIHTAAGAGLERYAIPSPWRPNLIQAEAQTTAAMTICTRILGR